ncbi:MAG: aminotransferase class I/II-fold pyridoxal phosphate-dependent enzyme, partial [Pseudomonadota bacterium]
MRIEFFLKLRVSFSHNQTATRTSQRFVRGAGNYIGIRHWIGVQAHRHQTGNVRHVDVAEQLAIERAKQLFNADYANVQPHSGSQANAAVYMALCEPGDVVLGMSLDHGGHLTHGAKVNFSGKIYSAVQYGLDEDTGEIDYDQVASLAREHKPKMIVAGFSAYSKIIDWQKFRDICDEVGAYLLVDMAHIAGLVAVGLYPNPVPYADVVTS